MEQKNEDNYIHSVMDRIKTEHLAPRSKWRFLFHDYSVLAISLSSLVIGTLSFSVFLNTFFTNDWDIYQQAGRSFWEHAFKSFPFLWLFFLCIFVICSYYIFSSSDNGYRYRQSLVISLCVIISLCLGAILFFAGLGEKVDDYLVETIPYYHTMTGNHTCLWMEPDRGLLAGMIISTGTEPMIIIDFKGNRWVATGTPKIPSNVINRPGEKVKIIGIAHDHFIFDAKELRLWTGSVEANPCQ